MATLKNKTFTHILSDSGEKATYAELLSLVLNVPTEGYRAQELRQVVKVLDACAEATDTVEIPDDSVPLVKRLVSQFNWRFPTLEAKKEVVEFCDAVEEL